MSKTTAETCANYGMRPVGGWGIRGWRSFCPACGFLSRLYANVSSARSRTETHRCDV